MRTKIVPCNDHVILKISKVDEEILSSGLIIPESVVEKPDTAVIVSSANENFKIGELVLFGKYAGTRFNINDEQYLAMPAAEIIVKLELHEEEEDEDQKTQKTDVNPEEKN